MMNQKNRYFGTFHVALFVLAATLFSCSSEEGIPVEGKIENTVPDELVTLSVIGDGGPEVIDTIEVKNDGSFDFRVKQEKPSFYILSFYGRQQMNLVLNGTEEKVVIEVNGTDPQDKGSVEGSKDTEYLRMFDNLMQQQNAQVQALNQEAIQARMNGDEAAIQDITTRYYQMTGNNQQEIKGLIWEITPSLAALYGLNALPIEEYFSFYDSLAERFNNELQGSPLVEDLNTRVDALRSLTIGSRAPEISLPDPDGNITKLSSLRGNYVLIDFWAAWCRPCRAENPNVVRLYNKYKDENFKILGVSLDRTRDAWIKAIKDDGLIWDHVSDLQYFRSEAAQTYQINAIPATYLIGPDGTILAKGLRGRTLEVKLQEIFG